MWKSFDFLLIRAVICYHFLIRESFNIASKYLKDCFTAVVTF